MRTIILNDKDKTWVCPEKLCCMQASSEPVIERISGTSTLFGLITINNSENDTFVSTGLFTYFLIVQFDGGRRIYLNYGQNEQARNSDMKRLAPLRE